MSQTAVYNTNAFTNYGVPTPQDPCYLVTTKQPMPKAFGLVTESPEDEMVVLAQAVKSAARKSSRAVESTSVVVAAATAGSSKRSVRAKKSKGKGDKSTDNDSANASTDQGATNSKKSRESIQAILDTLEEETMDQSWRNALSAEFTKPYFKKVLLQLSVEVFRLTNITYVPQLKQFLLEENASNTIYPPSRSLGPPPRLVHADGIQSGTDIFLV